MANKKFLLGILVMVLVFSLMLLGCPQPEPEATYSGNGHSYQIIDKSMSWTDAKSYCEEKGGYLVTITSAGEQAFIENFIKEKGKKNVYWIGGFRDTDNVIKWVTDEPFEYTNWDYGEPNNHGGIENKLQIAKFLNYRWNDGENVYNPDDDSEWGVLGFICEWDNR